MEFKIMKVTKINTEVQPDVNNTKFKYDCIGISEDESKLSIITKTNCYKLYDYIEIDVVANEDKK
ncbi:MAG: hypothetical protein WC307_05000 [Candidatus Nanoarchaeia archaeon]|jgi:hypothetical protein